MFTLSFYTQFMISFIRFTLFHQPVQIPHPLRNVKLIKHLTIHLILFSYLHTFIKLRPLLKIRQPDWIPDWISNIISHHNNKSPARFSDFDIEKFQGFVIHFFGSDFRYLVQVPEQVFKVLFDVPAAVRGENLKSEISFFSVCVNLYFCSRFLINSCIFRFSKLSLIFRPVSRSIRVETI